MSYGITVKNTSSLIQIGEDYSNYYLVQEGVVSVGSSGAVVNFPAYGSSLPIVATRAATVGVAIQSVTSSSVTFVAKSTVSVPYRIYLPSTSLASPSGYGLVVKNSSGGIVFDSTKKQLRVLGLISYSEVARAPGVGPNQSESPRLFSHGLGNRFVIHSHASMRRGTMVLVSGGPVAWILSALTSVNNAVYLGDAFVTTGLPWTDNAYPYYDGLSAAIGIIGD